MEQIPKSHRKKELNIPICYCIQALVIKMVRSYFFRSEMPMHLSTKPWAQYQPLLENTTMKWTSISVISLQSGNERKPQRSATEAQQRQQTLTAIHIPTPNNPINPTQPECCRNIKKMNLCKYSKQFKEIAKGTNGARKRLQTSICFCSFHDGSLAKWKNEWGFRATWCCSISRDICTRLIWIKFFLHFN